MFHSRLRTPSGQAHDVVYVGTTRGKVIKFVSASDENSLNPGDTTKPVVIEEIQVFPYHVSVTNLQVVKVKELDDAPRLIVLSNHEVRQNSSPKAVCMSAGLVGITEYFPGEISPTQPLQRHPSANVFWLRRPAGPVLRMESSDQRLR